MGISNLLSKWFDKEGRELPWRDTGSPYEIWVSEIILQQTRINQGTAYYHAFLERFPDIFSLASADIKEVLNVWQGLGYYSRARNMHETAKKIVKEFNGNFPDSYDEIIKLKGIGEYTAGAIASIAFHERVPAIDGNVKRVIARVYGITNDIGKPKTTKNIRSILMQEIPAESPGNFNEALMDLGSLICKPVNPSCNLCPLNELCDANKLGQVNEIPVKYKKTKTRIRHFFYAIIHCEENILINLRTGKDIWEGLYEFPLFESKKDLGDGEIYSELHKYFFKDSEMFSLRKISNPVIHILSHQKILAKFIHIEIERIPTHLKNTFIIVKQSEINQYPLPRLIEKYLPEIENKSQPGM
ncbi:MAG: A/G-specific adenine glycosylase [Bacteroidales bacterium]